MKQIANLAKLFLASLTLFLAACGASPIKDTEGLEYYTQVNMWVSKGKHLATNYRVDTLVPINSKVKILETSDETITFEVVDTGTSSTLVNVEKYTNKDIAQLFDRYFSREQVNLSQFDEETRKAISKGKVKKGMTRDQFILARGYPPEHRTPSLENDTWVYWRNRFAKQTVTFNEDTAAEFNGF